ncbi:MAG: thiamine-phosphate kinase, partial [Chloroflexi bacterium]|nr:thiamine-phosphate kinase [Chloroflexota bacterium]
KNAYPDDWLELALGGGEDYELLFTASAGVMDRAMAALDVSGTIIGQVVEGTGEVSVVDHEGAPVELARGGWDHFPR